MTTIAARAAAIREQLEPLMRRSATPGTPMFETILTILSNHPTWQHRLGDIKAARVRPSPRNGTVQLQLKTNKIWFTISWRECARPPGSAPRSASAATPKQRLTSAMREAIRRQVLLYCATLRFDTPCAGCGSHGVPLEVDHAEPPFATLRELWLAQLDVEPPTEFDYKSGVGAHRFKECDAALKRRWQQFHRRHATFQALCEPCNRAKGVGRLAGAAPDTAP